MHSKHNAGKMRKTPRQSTLLQSTSFQARLLEDFSVGHENVYRNARWGDFIGDWRALLPLTSIPQLHFDLITSSRWEKVISCVCTIHSQKAVSFQKSFTITPSSLDGDQTNTERLLTDFVLLYNLFLLDSLFLLLFFAQE